MKYRVIKRPIPMQPLAPEKYYAVPFKDGVITLRWLARKIAGRSSLTEGDVMSVLSNLLDEIPDLLMLGRSVDLSPFGIVRLSFGSEGAATEDEFSHNMIRNVKVIFTPNVRFKDDLNRVSFEKIDVNR